MLQVRPSHNVLAVVKIENKTFPPANKLLSIDENEMHITALFNCCLDPSLLCSAVLRIFVLPLYVILVSCTGRK